MRIWTRAMLPFSLLLLAAGCVSGAKSGELPPDERPIVTLESWAPSEILPGTRLVLQGTNLGVIEQVRLVGSIAGREVDVSIAPSVRSDDSIEIVFSTAVIEALGGAKGTFDGDLDLVYRQTVLLSTRAALSFGVGLAPSITSLGESVVYLGDEIVVSGAGFLDPAEGTSELFFDGVVELTATSTQVPVTKTRAPLDVRSRTEARLRIGPELLGVLPGTFRGGIFVRNVALDGSVTTSESLSIESIVLKATRIDGLTPSSVSRGQRLTIFGRGFLPIDAQLQTSTLFQLEGTLHTREGVVDFTGQQSLLLVPTAVGDNTRLEYVLRVRRNADGIIEGLGARWGRFSGTIAPLVLYGNVAFWGSDLKVELQIAPPKQVVHLRYLPGFSEALDQFGLRAAERAVKDRVLEVVRRDYQGVNIRFDETAPLDFAEYSTVEIGGVDPNHANLFGIDNTCRGEDCKDVGNLFLDDVIGGLNATSQQQGYYPYGGIFVASFLQFSATLASETNPLASARFDEIFSFAVPVLGGTAVTEDELTGGPRAALVAEAVRVLGNLIGNTITHEVGHSLGLAALDGAFHNDGDNPGWIMDAGVFRPFDERAEIDGAPTPVFAPYNRSYLEFVLPLEEP
ncbi:MAG: hypothetical protein KC609_14830 [Myxococcales bacterium]|nr:hypothetical protein [Myxococcales bacterium]